MGLIRFTFSDGGKVKVAGEGFSGPSCLEKIRPYEEAIKGRKISGAPNEGMNTVSEAEPQIRDH